MKHFLVILIILATIPSLAQTKPNKSYDAALAQKLGADEYGMKPYVMAFLTRGKTTLTDTAQRSKLLKAHLRNIVRLANEGKLIVAGPFLDDGTLRGIFIFNVRTVAEAQALVETDPSVQAGTLSFEMHPWYGSAAIMEITRIHKTLEKASVAD